MAFKIPNIDEVKGRLGLGGAQGASGGRSSRYEDEVDDYADDYAEEEEYDYGEYAYDDNADYAQPGYVHQSSVGSTMPALVTSSDIRERQRAVAAGEIPATSESRSSSGLDSLFASTGDRAARTGSATASRPALSRAMSVIRPTNYNEAELIAKGLAAGETVIVSLKSTPDALGKRILDFSFGAASVTGCKVDVIANGVYAFATEGLTDAEKIRLRDQGLL